MSLQAPGQLLTKGHHGDRGGTWCPPKEKSGGSFPPTGGPEPQSAYGGCCSLHACLESQPAPLGAGTDTLPSGSAGAARALQALKPTMAAGAPWLGVPGGQRLCA